MKFSKGKINNVNKKLLAGGLALIMIGAPLTGCTEENIFEYTVNEQGQYEVSGVISYSNLDDYYFLVIENSGYNTIEYYIASKEMYTSLTGNYFVYKNIFNNQRVLKTNVDDDTRKMKFCEKVANYLYATNDIKANYTKEEVEQILEGMKENYLNENNKQLVKEK